MHSRNTYGRLSGVLRVCVPLLLMGLLLYNPFSAIVSHGDGLAYQELPRHRATVGASELQHFSPIQAESAQLQSILEEIFAKLVMVKTEPVSHQFQEEKLPHRPEPMDNLWFRPPPAA